MTVGRLTSVSQFRLDSYMSVKPPRRGKLLLAAVTFDTESSGLTWTTSESWKGHLEEAWII